MPVHHRGGEGVAPLRPVHGDDQHVAVPLDEQVLLRRRHGPSGRGALSRGRGAEPPSPPASAPDAATRCRPIENVFYFGDGLQPRRLRRAHRRRGARSHRADLRRPAASPSPSWRTGPTGSPTTSPRRASASATTSPSTRTTASSSSRPCSPPSSCGPSRSTSTTATSRTSSSTCSTTATRWRSCTRPQFAPASWTVHGPAAAAAPRHRRSTTAAAPAAPTPARSPTRTRWPRRRPSATSSPATDDDLYILYTGGTTGYPKGVCGATRTCGACSAAASTSSPASASRTSTSMSRDAPRPSRRPRASCSPRSCTAPRSGRTLGGLIKGLTQRAAAASSTAHARVERGGRVQDRHHRHHRRRHGHPAHRRAARARPTTCRRSWRSPRPRRCSRRS